MELTKENKIDYLAKSIKRKVDLIKCLENSENKEIEIWLQLLELRSLRIELKRLKGEWNETTIRAN